MYTLSKHASITQQPDCNEASCVSYAMQCRWAQMGSFSAYDECKLWAWSVFGCAVLGLPASPEAGEPPSMSWDPHV